MLSVGVIEDSESPDIQLFFSGMILQGGKIPGSLDRDTVILSTMPPTTEDEVKYLGHYDIVFIRETSSLKELGGMDAFIRLAAGDVFQAVRAQVKAYGGDSLLNLRFTLTELNGSPNKNQAQCLLGVIGDIVSFSSEN